MTLRETEGTYDHIVHLGTEPLSVSEVRLRTPHGEFCQVLSAFHVNAHGYEQARAQDLGLVSVTEQPKTLGYVPADPAKPWAMYQLTCKRCIHWDRARAAHALACCAVPASGRA